MRRYLWILAGFLVISFVGCGPKAESPSTTGESAITTASTTATPYVSDASQVATVTGKVEYAGSETVADSIPVRGNPECSVFHKDGSVPNEELLTASGALKNAFVYVKEGLEGKKFPTPEASVEIDNQNCVYVPHVAGAMVDQPILLLNSDATLHNVHAFSKNSKSWNVGLPVQGMKVTKKFSSPEVMVALKCDVHPWMQGYLGVLSHPFYSVTDSAGEFSLKDLPAGTYTIEVWHEKLGTQSQSITIGPLEQKRIEFKFS